VRNDKAKLGSAAGTGSDDPHSAGNPGRYLVENAGHIDHQLSRFVSRHFHNVLSAKGGSQITRKRLKDAGKCLVGQSVRQMSGVVSKG
jgi:hypothetical protein